MRPAALPALSLLALASCSASSGADDPRLVVSCDRVSPPDTVSVHVVLEREAQESGGRLLVRVDSLRSEAGTRFDADTGFLVEAFLTTGPGRGCATVSPVGAEVWAEGAALGRSWVHVKSDRPVRIVLEKRDGTWLQTRSVRPGEAVDPLQWTAQ